MIIIDLFTINTLVKEMYLFIEQTTTTFRDEPYLDHVSERVDDVAVDVSSSVRRCERIGESFSRFSSEVRHQR